MSFALYLFFVDKISVAALLAYLNGAEERNEDGSGYDVEHGDRQRLVDDLLCDQGPPLQLHHLPGAVPGLKQAAANGFVISVQL